MDCSKILDSWITNNCGQTNVDPICKGLIKNLAMCLSVKNECIVRKNSVLHIVNCHDYVKIREIMK